MITLTELPAASAQDVFEQAARHMLTQRRPSVHQGRCVYKTPDGLQCVGGCFVSPEQYSSHNEGLGWEELSKLERVPYTHAYFIRQLQLIHDQYKREPHWPEKLKALAGQWNLNADFIDAEFPDWSPMPPFID